MQWLQRAARCHCKLKGQKAQKQKNIYTVHITMDIQSNMCSLIIQKLCHHHCEQQQCPAAIFILSSLRCDDTDCDIVSPASDV